MKNKDIFIDFTSLLDVTLIIIFFFIMFSSFESENAVKSAKDEADQALIEADSKLDEAEKLKAQADEMLAELENADERTAENIDAIASFSRNENIKLNLKMKNTGWSLEICQDEELIKTIDYLDDETLSKDLGSVFSSSFTESDTILCELIYDGLEPGSHKAYESIIKAFDVIKADYGYSYLYYSEIDLSVFEEDDTNE